MTINEQYELVKKAVDNNQLKDLLLGAPGYEWGNLKHIPANVKTDIGAILKCGLYVLYKNGYKDIPQKLKDTVLVLLDGQPDEIWTAYQIMWGQNYDRHHSQETFCILDAELSAALKKSILANKEKLMSCKELVGWNLKDGLWEDIARLERNLKTKYGTGLYE